MESDRFRICRGHMQLWAGTTYMYKGGGIGAAGAAMDAPLFSSNMGHAL